MSVTNQSVRDVLGRRIRDRRRSLGMGLRRIAGESGLSRSFLSQVERGERGILMENLLVLAPALKVSPSWFFGEAG
jgi:XRE family transcriptional regulator, regulator of sulfur utilization